LIIVIPRRLSPRHGGLAIGATIVGAPHIKINRVLRLICAVALLRQ
jgi:hypothetical protein